MMHKVFSIYDSKARAYLPPFILPRKEMALRVFSDCINAADHQFAAHPEDYSIWELGSFDDEAGQYTLLRTPQSHGTGLEYLRNSDSENDDHGEIQPPQVSDDSPVQSGPASANSS